MKLVDHPVLAGYVAGGCAAAVLALVQQTPQQFWWSTLLVVPLAVALGLRVRTALDDRLRMMTRLRACNEEFARLKQRLTAMLGDNPSPEKVREALRDEELLSGLLRKRPTRFRFQDGGGRPDVVFSGWCIGEGRTLLRHLLGNQWYGVGQIYLTTGGNIILLSKEMVVRGGRIANNGVDQSCSNSKPLDFFVANGTDAFRSTIDEMDVRVGGADGGFHRGALMAAWRNACAHFPPLAGKDVVEVD